MRNKLENPKRIAELNPQDTLRQIGLRAGDTFCDIGAGTGVFTFAAAGMTKNKVYAVEISDAMLEILRSEITRRNAGNVVTSSSVQAIPSDSCRIVLLCTVLHELPDVQDMINEVKRILAKDGLLSIIEFHKRSTPMGPPVEHRLDSMHVIEALQGYGLHSINQFILGENFYCLIFGLE